MVSVNKWDAELNKLSAFGLRGRQTREADQRKKFDEMGNQISILGSMVQVLVQHARQGPDWECTYRVPETGDSSQYAGTLDNITVVHNLGYIPDRLAIARVTSNVSATTRPASIGGIRLVTANERSMELQVDRDAIFNRSVFHVVPYRAGFIPQSRDPADFLPSCSEPEDQTPATGTLDETGPVAGSPDPTSGTVPGNANATAGPGDIPNGSSAEVPVVYESTVPPSFPFSFTSGVLTLEEEGTYDISFHVTLGTDASDPPAAELGVRAFLQEEVSPGVWRDVPTAFGYWKADSAMSQQFGLEVALGNVAGYDKVNKFGEAFDVDVSDPTDLWDGADGVTGTKLWVAPTTARLHDIVSDNAADDGVGSGMQTMRLYGLETWGSKQSFEDITLDGITPVTTSKSWVIVHRMVGLTFGSGGTNAGIITATAQTDTTVTAAIQPGEGQTLMAILGVPSVQTAHITTVTAAILGSGTAQSDLYLLVEESVDQATSGFITKEKFHVTEDAGEMERDYLIPKSFAGPCIIKLQANADTVNSKVVGAFDCYLVDT